MVVVLQDFSAVSPPASVVNAAWQGCGRGRSAEALLRQLLECRTVAPPDLVSLGSGAEDVLAEVLGRSLPTRVPAAAPDAPTAAQLARGVKRSVAAAARVFRASYPPSSGVASVFDESTQTLSAEYVRQHE